MLLCGCRLSRTPRRLVNAPSNGLRLFVAFRGSRLHRARMRSLPLVLFIARAFLGQITGYEFRVELDNPFGRRRDLGKEIKGVAKLLLIEQSLCLLHLDFSHSSSLVPDQ